VKSSSQLVKRAKVRTPDLASLDRRDGSGFEDGVLELSVEGAAVEQAPKRIEIEGSSG
jgi:hypothetical protein